jgi:stage II sporulation protein D
VLPYLKPVVSEDGGNYPWKTVVKPKELEKVLADLGEDIGKVKIIQVYEYTSSGKVSTIFVVGTKGKAVIKAQDFRRELGIDRIKSTRFAFGDAGELPPIRLTTDDDSPFLPDVEGSASVIKADDGPCQVVSEDGVTSVELGGSVGTGSAGKQYIGSDSYVIIWTDQQPASPSGIPATGDGRFVAVPVGEGLVVTGIGYGHGVGMSQYGALNYARKGWDFAKILLHYYSNVEMKKMYD